MREKGMEGVKWLWTQNKWMALVGCMWLLTSSGIMYDFSIFSESLKDVLGYTQVELNLVGTASDTGGTLGLAAGILSLYLPPWGMLLCGAGCNLVGYGSLWLVANGIIPPLPLWTICAFIFLGASSNTFSQTTALMVCVRNFPNSRGMVVGLLKGVVGLGGALYSQVYSAYFAPDQEGFILLAAVGPTLIVLLVLGVIKYFESEDEEGDHGFLYFFFVICIGLAVYILISIVISIFRPLTQAENEVIAIGLLVILALPLIVPIGIYQSPYWLNPKPPLLNNNPSNRGGEGEGGSQEREGDQGDIISIVTGQMPPPQNVAQDEVKKKMRDERETNLEEGRQTMPGVGKGGGGGRERGGVGEKGRPSKEDAQNAAKKDMLLTSMDELTLSTILTGVDFWLLFFSLLAGVASAFVVTDNLAQIGSAQGYSATGTAASLFNIWGFAGRAAGGFYSEHLMRSYGFPRPLLVAATQVLMAGGFMSFAFAAVGSMYVGTLAVGFGMGLTFSVTTATCSELFGLKNFGLAYNILTCAIPLGSYLFSTLLAGSVYDSVLDMEQLRSVGSDGTVTVIVTSDTCYGAPCFELTFIILAVLCVCGAFANSVLAWRTRRFYEVLAIS